MKKSTQWLEILCKHHAKLEFNVEKNRDCLCCIFAVLLLFEWVKNIFNHPVHSNIQILDPSSKNAEAKYTVIEISYTRYFE